MSDIIKVHPNDRAVNSIVVVKNGDIYFHCNSCLLFHYNRVTGKTESYCHKDKEGSLRAMVYDGDDTIYICVREGHRIDKFTVSESKFSVLAGTGELGGADGSFLNARFHLPAGICLVGQVIIVSEIGGTRQLDLKNKFTYSGSSNTRQSIDSLKLMKRASRITFDLRTDTLYVMEYNDRMISVISIDGVLLRIPRDSTIRDTKYDYSDTAHNHPGTPLCVSNDEMLIVDDEGLKSFDIRTAHITLLIHKKNTYGSLCLDNNGNLYLGTFHANVIVFKKGAWGVKYVTVMRRLLLAGFLKNNNNDCMLSKLPKDMIRIIYGYLSYIM